VENSTGSIDDWLRTWARTLADARCHYLIENFGVPEQELVATGFGQDQLKIPSDPTAAQNRRVQVINVGQ
jgi:hypothetical protein